MPKLDEKGMEIIKQHMKDMQDFLLKEGEKPEGQLLSYIEKGLVRGAEEHGEGSNKSMNLVEEMKQELRDFICYAFFQDKRLQDLGSPTLVAKLSGKLKHVARSAYSIFTKLEKF